MKILSYKTYMLSQIFIKESVEDEIAAIDQQIQQMKQAEEQLKNMDEDEFQEMIEALEEAPYPEVLKRNIINGVKAVWYPEIRELHVKLLTTIKEKITEEKTLQNVIKDPEVRELSEELTTLMSQKLNMDRKELETLLGKFVVGTQKYSKSKQDATKVSPSDPYGEEEWDDVSDEERIRKAFEEE